MRLLLALALALTAACRKAPAPAPAGPVEYLPADGSFRARVPGDWRVVDAPEGSRKAAFFGPPSGPAPFSEMMGVYDHPAADPGFAARAYVASQTGHGPGLTPGLTLGGSGSGLDDVGTREDPGTHGGAPQRVSTRVVAVLRPGGFYSLEHTWPAERAPDPAFDELLRSFRPAPATK